MKSTVWKTAASAVLATAVLVGAAALPPHSRQASAAAAAEAATPSVYVAPIDRAKLLAGSLFDFRVELNDWSGDPGSVSITVNGKDAAAFFGKSFVLTSTNNSREFTIRDVTIKQAGAYTVSVRAGTLSRTIRYDVVEPDLNGKKAKNVILFVGDGMAFSSVTMARILSQGLTEGKYNGLLEMDKFNQRAIVTTSGMDSLVTDSANSASAYNTGHKSAVNGLGIYPDNTEDSLDDPKVETLAEMLKRTRGMSVGVVTTSEIEDATPAAVVSHTRRRSDKPEIAEMLYKLQPEVVLGGGSAYFLPQSTPGSKRKDDIDVIGQFENSGYTFVENATQLAAAKTNKLLGLFHTADMNVYYDRSTNNKEALKTFTDQPNLWDMTQKAIDVLSQNDNGFFLMVEGASIDKQLHTMDWERSTYDAIEFDKAIGVARRFADQNSDTLIIVTADHSHSASIAGTYWEGDGKSGREAVRTYEASLFPTYVDADHDGFPDDPDPDRKLAVVFGAVPDYYEDYKFDKVPTAPAVDSNGVYIANPATLANPDDPNRDRFLHTGTINPATDSQEVHTADDVPLMAYGPGSTYFKGTMDNTEVFFGIANSLGLSLTGAKSDGKAWVVLTDFLDMIAGTAKYDGAKRTTTIQANGVTLTLDYAAGKATKDGKPVGLEYRIDGGKTLVTSASLLEALTSR